MALYRFIDFHDAEKIRWCVQRVRTSRADIRRILHRYHPYSGNHVVAIGHDDGSLETYSPRFSNVETRVTDVYV